MLQKMVAKEALHVEENTGFSQHSYEEEKTPSFRDLPVHSNSSEWDVESSSLDSNENDDGFFEFFSEDFTASAYPSSGKDIIFCGKLIPYKEPPPLLLPDDDHQTTHNHPETNNNNSKKLPTKEGFQLWKSFSFHKQVRSYSSNSKGSKNGENSSNSKRQEFVKANSKNNSYVYNTRKMTSDHHHHLSVGKVSLLSSPEKSSRWYFYMFGIARLPTEMKLRDIKLRQGRRSPSTMFASPEKISTEMIKEKVTMKRWRSGKVCGVF